jgi:hypothetical protein
MLLHFLWLKDEQLFYELLEIILLYTVIIIKEMKEYVLDQLDICEKLEHLIDEYLLLKMLKQ